MAGRAGVAAPHGGGPAAAALVRPGPPPLRLASLPPGAPSRIGGAGRFIHTPWPFFEPPLRDAALLASPSNASTLTAGGRAGWPAAALLHGGGGSGGSGGGWCPPAGGADSGPPAALWDPDDEDGVEVPIVGVELGPCGDAGALPLSRGAAGGGEERGRAGAGHAQPLSPLLFFNDGACYAEPRCSGAASGADAGDAREGGAPLLPPLVLPALPCGA